MKGGIPFLARVKFILHRSDQVTTAIYTAMTGKLRMERLYITKYTMFILVISLLFSKNGL